MTLDNALWLAIGAGIVAILYGVIFGAAGY